MSLQNRCRIASMLFAAAVLGGCAAAGGNGNGATPDGGTPSQSGTPDGGTPGQGGFSSRRISGQGNAEWSCAVRDDGKVECWDSNFVGGRVAYASGITNARGIKTDMVLLADGTADWINPGMLSSPPRQLAGVTGAVEVQVSQQDLFWLGSDGTLSWTSGRADLFQFSKLAGYTDITDFSAASGSTDHLCVVRTDHSVACGDAPAAPTPVAGITDAKAVSLGTGEGPACALRTNGGVVCWGNNHKGDLGNGTTQDVSGPVDVGVSNAIAVTSTVYGGCALIGDGSVKCWSDNEIGQIGLGTTDRTPHTATTVPGVTQAIALGIGGTSTQVLNRDMTITFWGGQNASPPTTVVPP